MSLCPSATNSMSCDGDQIDNVPQMSLFTNSDSANNMTPQSPRFVRQARARLERCQERMARRVCVNASPSLVRLRSAEGCHLRDRQSALIEKHHMAKSSAPQGAAGGVSIWPEMSDMRLSASEVLRLVASCVTLALLTAAVHRYVHGRLLTKLAHHQQLVTKFFDKHRIIKTSDNDTFHSSVLHWHSDFLDLMYDIEHAFETHFGSLIDVLMAAVYCMGLVTLVWYLAENIFTRTKLTPRRIKTWTRLLVVLGSWTVLMLHILLAAQRLENTIYHTVWNFAEQMAELVLLDFDLTSYERVLSYWCRRVMPPTGLGTLTVLGVVQVRDVAYYAQYYSLPLLTVFLTPVARLVLALRHVYHRPSLAVT